MKKTMLVSIIVLLGYSIFATTQWLESENKLKDCQEVNIKLANFLLTEQSDTSNQYPFDAETRQAMELSKIREILEERGN